MIKINTFFSAENYDMNINPPRNYTKNPISFRSLTTLYVSSKAYSTENSFV